MANDSIDNVSENHHVDSDDVGGGGRLLSDDHRRRSDLQLLQRAIRDQWDIPKAAFEALPAEVIRIAFSGHLSTRERLRAMEVVLSMHRQNQSAPGKRQTQASEVTDEDS